MIRQELKERAKTIVQLPGHFRTAIEEYFEGENGEGEAMYWWVDEQQEETISLTLDLAGNLTSLTIDLKQTIPEKVTLHEGQLKALADQFLSNHYPDALEALSCGEAKKIMDSHRFHYEQIVLGLPLANAGCFIDVASSGEIVNFKYYGLKAEPAIPITLITKEKLMDHVKTRLDFQLTIANLDTAIYDVKENGLQLVYEIEPFFMKYKAGVLEPTLTVIHDEDEGSQETYAPLPLPHIHMRKDVANEEIIGVTQEMEIVRDGELGGDIGIVWREREWEKEENDLSINSFFQYHNEDTVKAFISKKTGKVRSFMWFKERHGDLNLNREECYRKAIDLLHMVLPNCQQFLQLIIHTDEELDDTSSHESFVFRVHNGYGIPVYLERVLVAVNRLTGQIDNYSGPSFDLEELQQLPFEPAVSKKEASGIFLHHLDFELAWNESYEEEKGDILIFQGCDQYTRKSIRYIDALTGVAITEKE
ncbi:YcdB/YcdC domain-containing protein [Planococcus sp. CAU13]|uniref:YcdB/YcdC domain-containing protein n=1 Tax=Planococcus sp. CAU13 TaxID=1541197 RepID=UPI0005300422|nr:YcdB/YcdC domain-containing protein [Planococcus sp. CAU13]